jgi:hypothetical protein
MKKETIASVLESEGIKSSARGFLIEDEREGTCFLRAGSETVTVSRVTRVELREPFVVLENVKRERHFFAYEDVVGFRFAPASQNPERSAGFGR